MCIFLFSVNKTAFYRIFFFINRSKHVDAREPAILFYLVLDILKFNRKMKHTIRFLLARRFHYHNKPNIKIWGGTCPLTYSGGANQIQNVGWRSEGGGSDLSMSKIVHRAQKPGISLLSKPHAEGGPWLAMSLATRFAGNAFSWRIPNRWINGSS